MSFLSSHEINKGIILTITGDVGNSILFITLLNNQLTYFTQFSSALVVSGYFKHMTVSLVALIS